MDGSSEAWALVQAAELVRAGDVLLLSALTHLHGVDADVEEGEAIVLGAEEVAEIAALGDALGELAGQLQTLTSLLPSGGLAVTHDDVAAGAAEDLEHGIIDPLRVALAARVLGVGAGWHALAHGLRAADTHGAWGRMTIDDVLGHFRGASEELVQNVLASAGLSSGAELANCEDWEIARLAGALEEHAPVED